MPREFHGEAAAGRGAADGLMRRRSRHHGVAPWLQASSRANRGLSFPCLAFLRTVSSHNFDLQKLN